MRILMSILCSLLLGSVVFASEGDEDKRQRPSDGVPLQSLFDNPDDDETEVKSPSDLGVFRELDDVEEESSEPIRRTESFKAPAEELEEHDLSWKESVDNDLREIKENLEGFQSGLNDVQAGLKNLKSEVGTLKTQVGENKKSLQKIEGLVIDSNKELKNLRKDLRGTKYQITDELVQDWQTKVRHELKGEITAFKVSYQGKVRYLDEDGYLISSYLVNGEVGQEKKRTSSQSGVVYTNTESGVSNGNFNTQGSTRGSCYIDRYGRRQCR